MNAVQFGVVTAAPDGSGMGQVLIGGTTRRCYFDPLRFAAPWGVPAEGDRVAVANGTPQMQALWLIGLGAASYEYSGGD